MTSRHVIRFDGTTQRCSGLNKTFSPSTGTELSVAVAEYGTLMAMRRFRRVDGVDGGTSFKLMQNGKASQFGNSSERTSLDASPQTTAFSWESTSNGSIYDTVSQRRVLWNVWILLDMLNLNNNGGPRPKCYFTSSTLPGFINHEQPSVKKRPFCTIQQQTFSHSVIQLNSFMFVKSQRLTTYFIAHPTLTRHERH